MFTGIIKGMGEIIEIESSGKSRLLGINCDDTFLDINTGDSIAVDGVCLTATEISEKGFKCDVSINTVNSTTLKDVVLGSKVNLEDALKASDKLGGHLVTGHIDTTIKFLDILKEENAYKLAFEMPDRLKAFIAPRGSVALNGISLTVVEKQKNRFTVYVIPHTFDNTNISLIYPGDLINIECDIISRYVVNFLNSDKDNIKDQSEKDRELKEMLEKYGFYK